MQINADAVQDYFRFLQEVYCTRLALQELLNGTKTPKMLFIIIKMLPEPCLDLTAIIQYAWARSRSPLVGAGTLGTAPYKGYRVHTSLCRTKILGDPPGIPRIIAGTLTPVPPFRRGARGDLMTCVYTVATRGGQEVALSSPYNQGDAARISGQETVLTIAYCAIIPLSNHFLFESRSIKRGLKSSLQTSFLTGN
jgi:hypothetical protein